MVSFRVSLLSVLAAASVSCAAPAANIDAPLTVEPILLTSSPGSFLPRFTVNGDKAILSWIEPGASDNALVFVERTATGWSERRRAAGGTDFFLNYADLPTVMRLSNGTLVAQWLRENEGADEAYDMLLSFSTDEGKTWSAPATPHHDGTKTQHGFASMVELPGSKLGLLWLDGRQITGEAGHDNMSVRAAVFDAGGVAVSDTVVDDRVCECCPMSAAMTADGPIVAYRDRSAAEIRDIAVSRLVNGAWTAPKIVHDDKWEIRACPVNGPAVAAHDRTVAVAWFTAANDQGRAFAAFSTDAGATFGAPIRLDEAGSKGRVDVAMLPDGSAVAMWLEGATGTGQLRIRRVDANGKRGPAQTVSSGPEGYAHLVRRGAELLLAWTETERGMPVVKTAAVRTP